METKISVLYAGVNAWDVAYCDVLTFDTEEEAFARYKGYKESFIKKMANQYRSKISDKVYQAMMNWKVEITD